METSNGKCQIYVHDQAHSVLFETNLSADRGQFHVCRDVYQKTVAADGYAPMVIKAISADSMYRAASSWDKSSEFCLAVDCTNKKKVMVLFAPSSERLSCDQWPAQVSSLKVFGNLHSEQSERLHRQLWDLIEAQAEIVEAERNRDHGGIAVAQAKVADLERLASKAASREAKRLVAAAAEYTQGSRNELIAEAHTIRNQERADQRELQPLNVLVDTDL